VNEVEGAVFTKEELLADKSVGDDLAATELAVDGWMSALGKGQHVDQQIGQISDPNAVRAEECHHFFVIDVLHVARILCPFLCRQITNFAVLFLGLDDFLKKSISSGSRPFWHQEIKGNTQKVVGFRVEDSNEEIDTGQ